MIAYFSGIQAQEKGLWETPQRLSWFTKVFFPIRTCKRRTATSQDCGYNLSSLQHLLRPAWRLATIYIPFTSGVAGYLGESLFFKENDLVHWSLPILWHINTVSMSPYKIYECQTLWVLVSALVSLRIW